MTNGNEPEFWGPEGPCASYGEWLADLEAHEAAMDAALDEPEPEAEAG